MLNPKNQILKVLKNSKSSLLKGLEAVYLFGSFADCTQTESSDVDIALLFSMLPDKVRALAGSDLQLELSKALKRSVDLVDLRTVSTVFQNEIIVSGERFLTLEEASADEFEMMTLSFYQKLNEERKEILEEFKTSGVAVQ
jgi:uncharacterized protein